MRKPRKSGRRKVGWVLNIFFITGLMLFAGAWWTTRDTIDLLDKGVPAGGVVVDLSRSTDSDGRTTYAPVVEVTSREHGVFRFASSLSSSPPSFAIGERVDVIVDRENRERVVIDSFGQKWFLPLVLIFMGSIFSLISLIGLGVLKRAGRKNSGGTGT